MKLLYITNGINGAGGLERVLSIKASYLADQYGYEVTILSLNNGDLNPFYSFSANIKIKNIQVSGNPLQYSIAYIKGIQKVVSETMPDVIAVCDDGLKAFFTPIILGKNTPIIYERHVSKKIEEHNSDNALIKIKIKITWFLMGYLGNKFQKFIVLTEGNLSEWKNQKNLKVISNPLSFYPKKSSSLTNKKVIAVGRQCYQKGYDILLAVWEIVNKRHPDWVLEIYGKKDLSQNLDSLTRKLQLENTVSFFDPVKEVDKRYLESSIYVMTSRNEGFGMVLIEAMACGVPCVSFDCPSGPSDIIKNCEDGLLIYNGDIEAFAKAIMHLIKNEELRKEMGAKAKENVKRYAPDNVVPLWDELFKSLVK
jgi:glycosyltransferase involved in cell wall biosynthesis